MDTRTEPLARGAFSVVPIFESGSVEAYSKQDDPGLRPGTAAFSLQGIGMLDRVAVDFTRQQLEDIPADGG